MEPLDSPQPPASLTNFFLISPFSSHPIFSPLVSPIACKGGEGNLIPDRGSDGAGSSQQPVPCLPEPAGYPQRQGFLTEKVSNHTHTILDKPFWSDSCISPPPYQMSSSTPCIATTRHVPNVFISAKVPQQKII